MRSLDPTFPLFPALSFLGFVLALVPLPWHLQAWNAGTCSFMLWTALSCLVEFINALVWAGNVNNPVPVWCDISSKFLLGAGVGITASTLCISRRLHGIATIQTVSISRDDKRRAVIIDLFIAVGIPVLVMILHYVVQPHRYDILEDIGCYPATYNTLPAYFLVFMWPVLLGVISFVYSALTLRAFWHRRVQFAQLVTSHTGMNVSRYLRLMLLAFSDMLFTVPLGVFSIYIATKGVGLAPWISWEDTHYNFSRVQLVPTVFWRSDPSFQTSVELTRWLFPASSFIFFGLFGFASEAQKHYRIVFWFIVKPFGFKPAATKKPNTSALPIWKEPLDSKSFPKPVGFSPSYTPSRVLHSKTSTGCLSSASDTTLHVDIEKANGLSLSTPSTPISDYSYPPLSAKSAETCFSHQS